MMHLFKKERLFTLVKKENLLKPALILTAFYLFCSPAYALPSNCLLSATHHIANNTETIEIKTTGDPDVYIFRLFSPKRIVCTLSNTFFSKIHQSQTLSGGTVSQLRISQNTKNNTRLVLNVLNDKDYNIRKTQLSNKIHLLTMSFPIEVKPIMGKKQIIAEKPVGQKKTVIVKKHTGLGPLLFAQIGSDFPFESSRLEPLIKKTDTLISLKENKNQKKIKNKIAPPKKKFPPQINLAENLIPGSGSLDLDQSGLDESIFEQTDTTAEKQKDLRLSATIQARVTKDTRHDNNNENKTSLKNRTILKLGYKNNLVLSGISDYLYFGSQNSTDSHDIEIYEAYLRQRFEDVTITVGKQIKRWGKTDQISPIDTLNPENNTEFITPSYEERKIPVWMADLVFKKDNFFIEGVFIPFFEPARFDYFGTDWATFSHLKDDIEDAPLSQAQKNYFSSIGVKESEPKDEDAFEYALRAGGTIKQFDFGFTYHYAIEDLPNFQSFPIKNLSLKNPGAIQDFMSSLGTLTMTNEAIHTKYMRTHIYGFEFETVLSAIGLRGEAVFKDKESFLTSSLTSVRKPSFSWIIGADYTSENEWYINIQFAHQHIADFDSSILSFEQDNYSLIGEINKNIVSDWLKMSLQCTTMFNDGSYYLSPRLIYSYINNFEATLGVHLFEGDDNSIFGQYTKNDQIFLNLKYYF